MVEARTAIVEVLVLLGDLGQARRLAEIAEASADPAELDLRIASEWGLTEVQAQALADVQFRTLTRKRRQENLDELEQLKASRERLCAQLEL